MINTLTGCQIKKTTNRFVIGTAVMAVACSSIALTPATAGAVIRDFSCSKGGFTGTLKIDYDQHVVRRINCKIDKGNNRGGNKADVFYSSGIPGIGFSNYTAIQDGQWRYLGGPYIIQSKRPRVWFTFDKSKAFDPSCQADIKL